MDYYKIYGVHDKDLKGVVCGDETSIKIFSISNEFKEFTIPINPKPIMKTEEFVVVKIEKKEYDDIIKYYS